MTGYTAAALAEQAFAAFDAEADGWQDLWAVALRQLRKEIEALASSEWTREQCLAVDRLLGMTADALADASVGARNPLVQSKIVANRPLANSIDKTRRRAIALVAGAYVAMGRAEGRTVLDCYRDAARSLRAYGASVRWQEVRSAWVNRHRYTEPERMQLDAALRPFSISDAKFDRMEVARQFALEAAQLLKSKVSIF